MPNVAHESVRLALLDGRFGDGSRQEHDRAQLRFFSRRGVFSLFENAGFAIAQIEGIAVEIERPTAEVDQLPESARAQLDRDPDARVCEFVVVARPAPSGLPSSVLSHFHSLHGELAEARRALDEGAAEIERLTGHLVRVNASEAELSRCLDATDNELEERLHRLTEARASLAAASGERDAAAEEERRAREQLEVIRATRAWQLATRFWRVKALLATR